MTEQFVLKKKNGNKSMKYQQNIFYILYKNILLQIKLISKFWFGI